jgi:hypothetical protein
MLNLRSLFADNLFRSHHQLDVSMQIVLLQKFVGAGQAYRVMADNAVLQVNVSMRETT